MSIFRDFSGKIDPAIVEVIADIHAVMQGIGAEFLIIGAAARDIVFEAGFRIHAPRLTRDVDFGVQLAAWREYAALTTALLASGRFKKDAKQAQRFVHQSGTIIDLVPFGQIESPEGKIEWPPDQDPSMSTVGLKEALQSSLQIRLREESDLIVNVSSPAGLAILKLVGWNDRKRLTKGISDAQDLAFLIKHYAEVEDLFPKDLPGMQDVPDEVPSFEGMSAWLLGKHIAAIAATQTRYQLVGILEAETDETGELRLASHMVFEQLAIDPVRPREEASVLLDFLKQGIVD